MKMIASADNNWAIGYKGSLLAHVSADMKFFKSKTVGNVVILGITTDESFKVEGAEIVHSTDELLETVEKYDDDSLYVIGGGSIYDQLLPYCDTAYITKFDKTFEADTYIKNLDEDENWKLVEDDGPFEEKGIIFRFCTYKRAE